jgi:hypothetical protein
MQNRTDRIEELERQNEALFLMLEWNLCSLVAKKRNSQEFLDVLMEITDTERAPYEDEIDIAHKIVHERASKIINQAISSTCKRDEQGRCMCASTK